MSEHPGARFAAAVPRSGPGTFFAPGGAEPCACPLTARQRQPARLLIRIGGALTLCALTGCFGYNIGPQSLFPPEIRTVHVPMFESDSFRRYQAERLTEAVCKEIEKRSTLKVVSDPNADSVLTGRITGDTKRLTITSIEGDPRELQTDLVVQVAWTDRRGAALRDSVNVPMPAELTQVQGSALLVPEVGQSVATQQQIAIERIAQQIVGLMEAPW